MKYNELVQSNISLYVKSIELEDVIALHSLAQVHTQHATDNFHVQMFTHCLLYKTN